MKIFDWVHRRFANKDGLAESGKKSCVIDGDGEGEGEISRYMRDNINASNVFDGWREGILSIGTLGMGYDALKDEKQNESDVDRDEEEEEEANPLVYASHCEVLFEIKAAAEEDVNEEFDLELEFNAMIMNIPKKERITLAELFSADSEKLQKKEKGEMTMIKENKSNYKHGFSFAKKLIGDKDARPIQKLHRLMRMMLKRKIHPDQGVNKQNGVNSTNKCGNVTTETTSLLPAQVADADAII